MSKSDVIEISEVVMLDISCSQVCQPSIARDRARRVTGVGPPKRYDFEDMMNYALQVAEEVHPHELSTYKEVVSCSKSAQWY